MAKILIFSATTTPTMMDLFCLRERQHAPADTRGNKNNDYACFNAKPNFLCFIPVLKTQYRSISFSLFPLNQMKKMDQTFFKPNLKWWLLLQINKNVLHNYCRFSISNGKRHSLTAKCLEWENGVRRVTSGNCTVAAAFTSATAHKIKRNNT